MASNFFRKIPRVEYKFKYSDKEETHNMVNVTVKYVLSYKTRKNMTDLYKFSWPDNLRPDSFAEAYYGMNELYWLGLFSGNIYDVHNELPRNENQLFKYNFLKYKEDPGFLDWATLNSKLPTEESVFEYMISTPGMVVDDQGDALKDGIGQVARVVAETNIVLSGLQTIDGKSLQTNDRVLLTSQTNPTENGLYIVKPGAWIGIGQYNYVYVQQGNQNEETIWDIVATNPLMFSKFPVTSQVMTLMAVSEKENESKRYISIIDNSFAPKFRAEFDSAMNKLQAETRT